MTRTIAATIVLATALTIPLGGAGCGGDRSPPTPSGRVATPPAPMPAPAIDATAAAQPRPEPTVPLRSGCRCPGTPKAAPAAAHDAFVTRVNTLNGELEKYVRALSSAVGARAAADRGRGWTQLRCGLDCLAHQFPRLRPAGWTYLQRVAQFLDLTHTRRRGPIPPDAWKPIEAAYNRSAYAANFTIGLELVGAAPTPAASPPLDQSSFAHKATRWAKAIGRQLDAFSRAVLAGPPATRSQRLAARVTEHFVALSRIEPVLRHALAAGRRLKCAKGTACRERQLRLRATLAALDGLAQRLGVLGKHLLRATSLTPAEAQQRLAPVVTAYDAWRRALRDLRGGG